MKYIERSRNESFPFGSAQGTPSTPHYMHPERSRREQFLSTSAPAKPPEMIFAIGSAYDQYLIYGGKG